MRIESVFFFIFVFSFSLQAQVMERKDTTSNAPLHHYKLKTEDVSDLKNINWKALKKNFNGNQIKDSITIEFIFVKQPDLYSANKSITRYHFKSQGLTQNIDELIAESKEFNKFLIAINKE